MELSRRKMLTLTGASAGAGAMGLAASSCAAKKEAKPAKTMVGACGLSCMACPLMKAGKCKGCASGKEASDDMLKMKSCPVLQCAAKKGIDYCGTGCKMFTKCSKLIGHPYDKSYMVRIEKRLD